MGAFRQNQGKPIRAGIRLLLLMSYSTRNLAFETLEPPRCKTFPKKRVRVWVQPASRFLLNVKHFFPFALFNFARHLRQH